MQANTLILDTATTSGYTIHNASENRITHVGHFTAKGEDYQTKVFNLIQHVDAIAKRHNIGRLVIEDIYNNRDPRIKSAFERLAEYRGALMLWSKQNGVPLSIISNIAAKRTLFSHRKPETVTKDMVRRRVVNLGYTPATQDEADSIMLAVAYMERRGTPIINPNGSTSIFPRGIG